MNDVLAAIGSLGEELRKANERIERQAEAIRQLREALIDIAGRERESALIVKIAYEALAATENL